MNELDLIQEVEKRPILYDKSQSGFNKTKLRDEAWKEIQDALNTTEVECKKRWRSLRDSYLKLMRTHGSRTRWPYVNAMNFLKPHVIEPKPEDTSTSTTASPMMMITTTVECNADAPAAMGHEPDVEDDKTRSVQCLPDLTFMREDPASPQPSPKRPRTTFSDDDNNTCCNDRNTTDELFLLSCAPTLKRLNSKQNAVTRLKIQQILLESEFGSQAAVDLSYAAPSSDSC